MNEQLCLCKSLTTWYFYDMFMRMSAIFMTILSFMAVVRNVHCLNGIIFQLCDMSKVITKANWLNHLQWDYSNITNLYSKFDDTNKLTSNLIIVTVHAYLNEIFKVIKNGTKNEIKWFCIHINTAYSDYNGTFYSLKDIKYSYFMDWR